MAPPPAPLWKGLYAGLNAGGTWGKNNSINVTTYPVGSVASSPAYWALGNGSIGSRANNLVGFIGGGQIGYNWQPTFAGYSFVTGAEADIQGIAGTGNGSHNGYWLTATPQRRHLIQLLKIQRLAAISWNSAWSSRLARNANPVDLRHG